MVAGYETVASRRVPRTRSPGWGMMGNVAARAKDTGGPPCSSDQVGGLSLLWPAFRVSTMLDNLIHKKELPVIIAIFIDPGSTDLKGGKNGGPDRSNRSFEYDTLSDQYVRFLEKEILPEVGKKYNLRTDAKSRAIGGIS